MNFCVKIVISMSGVKRCDGLKYPNYIYIYIYIICSIFSSFLLGLTFPGEVFADCSASISTDGDISLNLEPGTKGTTGKNITITTDCTYGYDVYLSSSVEDNALYLDEDDTSNEYIEVASGTLASPAALTSDTYGFALGSNISTNSNSFVGLSSTQVLIGSNDEASAGGGDSIALTYGAAVAADKTSGTYQMADDGAVVYTVVAYESYTVTFDANGGAFTSGATTNRVTLDQDTTAVLSGMYELPTREGYNFAGWYTDTTYSTEANLGVMDNPNPTVYAKWEEGDLVYVYKTPGTCVFGGGDVAITSSVNSCISYINPDGELVNYAASLDDFIDTGISLYNQENSTRDFEVGFTIESYGGSENVAYASLFSNKLDNESAGRAGLIFRKNSSSNNAFQIRQRLSGTNADAAMGFTNPITSSVDVVIKRTNNVISYQFNGGNTVELDSRTADVTFNLHSLFGATVDSTVTVSDTIGSVERYLVGTLSNMYIKLGEEQHNNYVARIGDIYYNSLKGAVAAVPTDGTKTTIELLQDVSEVVSISGGRNIHLDLGGFTASNTSDSNVFALSNGTLELVNGTVSTTASTKSEIEIQSTGILVVGDGVTIQANGARQAIYNVGGSVTILDGAYITGSAPERATVANNGGTTTITGGTIISTAFNAVYNQGGTLIIGTKDDDLDATSPVIQGKNYGVIAYANYKFYNGIIKGETYSIGIAASTSHNPSVTTDTSGTKISEIESGSQKTFGVDGDYKTLYLGEVGERIISVKLDVPETFPTSSNNSPLIPSWTLGRAGYGLSSNGQTYESVLLMTEETSIDVADLPTNDSDVEAWYSEIGEGVYYLPTIPSGYKRIRITMDSGYATVASRKNPKVIFLQGNSIDKLTPNGVNDGSGGATDIPNTFGERQIVDSVTEVYQIENGSVIDLSPYWDDSMTYHAISIRGYGSTLAGIKGATIEYISDIDYEYVGTVTRTVTKSFQGALVDTANNELFQIMDGGHTMVLDLDTLEVKREFDIPSSDGSGHHSSVEWLDAENKIFLSTACTGNTSYANKIYVYDMSDEDNITMETLTVSALSSDNYSYMSDLAYDSDNELLYVGGYTPDSTTRSNILITAIDMSPYLASGTTSLSTVGSAFTTTVYHMQDGGFYNGKIYYLVDSTQGKGPYDTFSILKINPDTEDIEEVLSVPLSTYKEAESVVIVPGNDPYILMSYWDGSNTEYYYKKYLYE